MAGSAESDTVLFGRLHEISDGCRVRLRLAQVSDGPAIGQLLARQGLEPDRLQVAQLVHFDPRRRYVICAAGLIDSSEKLLGIGAITFDGDGSPQPDLLLTDERYGDDELRRLLSRALRGMAESIRRGRAA